MKDFTNGPAPGFFRLWWHKGALLPVLLAVFAGATSFFSYQSLHRGQLMDAEGVIVTATATERRVLRDSDNDKNYYVSFSYDAQGVPQSVEKKVSAGLYNQLAPGTTRDIRYLASRPRIMEHTVGQTWKDGQTIRWVSLAIGVASLFALWWTARPAIEALRARRWGAAEWARVLYVDERKRRTKNGTTTRYVLIWRDARGQQGESLPSSSRNRYFRYGPTSDIEVYRDSRGKTWWVGDVGPRAVARTVPDAGQSRS